MEVREEEVKEVPPPSPSVAVLEVEDNEALAAGSEQTVTSQVVCSWLS